MKKIIKRILLVLFTIVFVFSAANFGFSLYEKVKTEKVNKAFQEQYVTPVIPELTPDPDETVEKAPISVNFEALIKRNGDIVGWLYCEGTPINYPVVKGADNQEYLRKAIDGSYLKSGSLFADYRNGAVGQDGNYIIYGHNTSGESMFGTLTKYKKQEYYDAHPVLYFLTPTANYKIELVSGNTIHRHSDFYRPDIDMNTVLGNYIPNSTFKTELELSGEDKYISLSTCVWDFTDARYVIIGRITEVE